MAAFAVGAPDTPAAGLAAPTTDLYTVTVATGDRPDAGTDANVHIVLYGPDCVIGGKLLDTPGHNDFERSATDTFTVRGRNLSTDPVNAIELLHDDANRFPGWFVDSVRVRNDRTGAARTFALHRWLAKDERPFAVRYYTNGASVRALPDTNPGVAVRLPTARCDDTRARPQPGQVSITGLEVTQGIQTTGAPLIPLLANRPTFVRVYVRTGDGGGVPGVGASVAVAGIAGALKPISPAGPLTALPGGSDPQVLTDSFLFRLTPAMEKPGTRGLVVRLALPASRQQAGGAAGQALLTSRQTLAFHDLGERGRVTLFVVSYGYRNVPRAVRAQEGIASGTVWKPRPISDLDHGADLARNLLPVSAIAIHHVGRPLFDCGAVSHEQADHTLVWSCDGGLEAARSWAGDYVDRRFPQGGHWIVLLQPEGSLKSSGCACGEHATTSDGNHRINLQEDVDYSSTLAHEVAHGFGVLHTPNVHDDHDLGYPRSQGLLGPYVGIRYASPSAPAAVSTQTAGGALYDIMAYARPDWISPYTYCKALDGETHGAVRCAPTLDRTVGGPFPYTIPPK